MPISVRRIDHAEAVRSGHVIVQAYAEPPWDESWSLENATKRLEELITTPHSIGLAAFYGSELVGFAFALPHTSAGGTGLHLAEIAILPAYHRMGIGSTLLSRLEREATILGYSQIWLVSRQRGGVADYYHANGYDQSKALSVYMKALGKASNS